MDGLKIVRKALSPGLGLPSSWRSNCDFGAYRYFTLKTTALEVRLYIWLGYAGLGKARWNVSWTERLVTGALPPELDRKFKVRLGRGASVGHPAAFKFKRPSE